ncbi:MAG TPA: bifunctional phosphopantothenoylcysteine decarboxylase/phosphopantothenate--cysteine ligase CoaBC [Firmicutes bacterium]|nr:bifunctional phosphopantothenoylcysteine decarboxylase/phosphopantothenate--cysteine ligase CoaBC [Bacillota bacterium]HAA37336.1 bifunctional phosphopantothenoylcysteine decarboxylase/phosphopantothenate--cysteine ligase CoaBC [Bacillota bacterium]
MLSGKNVVLGITGGIAVYKSAELCRLFIKAGAKVRVVMTEAAKAFVTPLTFQTLTGSPVYDQLFIGSERFSVEHVGLAQEADLIVIAPATANTIGKIANGIADNLLTTTVMAAKCPILLAPAMNTQMYDNPFHLANLERLQNFGYAVVGPDQGELACGDTGRGRMSSPQEIFAAACRLLLRKEAWQGRRLLVTAGPTQEALDPVRFLTNHSSGKMGYAIAQAAAELGADVTLVSGPVTLPQPYGVDFVSVTTAQEMYEAVLACFSNMDVVVGAAAVADYRPGTVSEQKIKKSGELIISLTRNPDILAALGRMKQRQILVGFAAETENLREHALAKLERKNLDLIVANDLTQPGAGFGTDTNIVTLYFRDGRERQLEKLPKREVAIMLLEEINALLTAAEEEN